MSENASKYPLNIRRCPLNVRRCPPYVHSMSGDVHPMSTRWPLDVRGCPHHGHSMATRWPQVGHTMATTCPQFCAIVYVRKKGSVHGSFFSMPARRVLGDSSPNKGAFGCNTKCVSCNQSTKNWNKLFQVDRLFKKPVTMRVPSCSKFGTGSWLK